MARGNRRRPQNGSLNILVRQEVHLQDQAAARLALRIQAPGRLFGGLNHDQLDLVINVNGENVFDSRGGNPPFDASAISIPIDIDIPAGMSGVLTIGASAFDPQYAFTATATTTVTVVRPTPAPAPAPDPLPSNLRLELRGYNPAPIKLARGIPPPKIRAVVLLMGDHLTSQDVKKTVVGWYCPSLGIQQDAMKVFATDRRHAEIEIDLPNDVEGQHSVWVYAYLPSDRHADPIQVQVPVNVVREDVPPPPEPPKPTNVRGTLIVLQTTVDTITVQFDLFGDHLPSGLPAPQVWAHCYGVLQGRPRPTGRGARHSWTCDLRVTNQAPADQKVTIQGHLHVPDFGLVEVAAFTQIVKPAPPVAPAVGDWSDTTAILAAAPVLQLDAEPSVDVLLGVTLQLDGIPREGDPTGVTFAVRCDNRPSIDSFGTDDGVTVSQGGHASFQMPIPSALRRLRDGLDLVANVIFPDGTRLTTEVVHVELAHAPEPPQPSDGTWGGIFTALGSQVRRGLAVHETDRAQRAVRDRKGKNKK